MFSLLASKLMEKFQIYLRYSPEIKVWKMEVAGIDHNGPSGVANTRTAGFLVKTGWNLKGS